jgi:xanthine dehydrogenase accessory factor
LFTDFRRLYFWFIAGCNIILGIMKNIYSQFLKLYTDHPELVLSTVTACAGSTPQKPGSSALFGEYGLLSGTVGGGIVESKVQELSRNSIKTKNSVYSEFTLNRDAANGEDAICGGQISILIDANPLNHLLIFEEMFRSVQNRIPGVLITVIAAIADNKVNISRFWMTEKHKPPVNSHFLKSIEEEVNRILSKRDPNDFREMEMFLPGDEAASTILLEPVFPPLSLVIAGAGHIGKALAHLGYMLEYEVTVIDDRPEFANCRNIPDADKIVVKDIGIALRNLKKYSDTFIVIVTRGHQDDAEALKACIGSGAGYIGMIGSRNKIATMRREFIEYGWATKTQFDFIHAPVGLDIKSKTVQEIAVSIAAEIIQIRNRGTKGRND